MEKSAQAVVNRLERYRALIAALDGAKPAQAPFYVRRDRCLADQVAARLLLQLRSAIAVLGGVGSGKTTEMLVVAERMNKSDGWRAIYVDVALRHDLTELRPGTVLTTVGLALADDVADTNPAAETQNAILSFRRWARGHSDYPEYEEPDDGSVWIPGLLKPPERPFYGDVQEMTAKLEVLLRGLRRKASETVFLLDSLDRIQKPDDFLEAYDQDVRALAKLGSVVVSAPVGLLYGSNRPILDRFTEFYYQTAVDTDTTSGRAFLGQVLRARLGEDVLPEKPIEQLVRFSGGALRDLIVLARGAAEQAYLGGSDRIETHHVRAAANTLGRKQMLGLTEGELARLRHLAKTGSFVSVSDTDISLLVTRRILEYQNGGTRYAVHPTIALLLKDAF